MGVREMATRDTVWGRLEEVQASIRLLRSQTGVNWPDIGLNVIPIFRFTVAEDGPGNKTLPR